MKRIKVGCIPAAGKGKRINCLPLTKVLPKPMLPIGNKPILEYVVLNMKAMGVKTIFIIIGHKKDVIMDYFEDGSEFGVDIQYIYQREPKGIAHAINLTRDYITDNFITILGDDFTISNSLINLVHLFFEKNATVVEGVVEEKNLEVIKDTCCVKLDENERIIEIIEKPKNPISNLRGIGIYLFSPEIFEFIDKTKPSKIRNELEITNTIRLVSKIGKAYGGLIDGININVNKVEDLMRAWKMIDKWYHE